MSCQHVCELSLKKIVRMYSLKLWVFVIAFAMGTLSSAFGGSLSVDRCTWCHGATGQGYATAPRLAGQQAEYIKRQLANFHHRVRDAPFSRQFMWGATQALSDAEADQLAQYFSALPAQPARDGSSNIVAAGRLIYKNGAPEADIPACSACHGPQAEGASAVPRLAGLSFYYLRRRLVQWGEGYNSAASGPMPKIASKLSAEQVESISSYLSFME